MFQAVETLPPESGAVEWRGPGVAPLRWDWRLVAAYDSGPHRLAPLPVYDDAPCYGSRDAGLFIFGAEFGPQRVIAADSWESAWSIAIDESPTVNLDDVPHAYGYWIYQYQPGAFAIIDDDVSRPVLREGAKPSGDYVIGYASSHAEAVAEAVAHVCEVKRDLVEGYEYQSSATAASTGIVAVGHYAWLCTVAEWNARQAPFGNHRITAVYSVDC